MDAAFMMELTERPAPEREIVIPRTASPRARLRLTRGACDVKITAAELPGELLRARFEGSPPSVQAFEGDVAVRWPAFDWLRHLLVTPTHASISLASGLPWRIEASGGLARVDADLRGIDLEELEIRGGVSELRLDLSEPTGLAPILVRGGASQVQITRPAAVPVRLVISGGASNLRLDGQCFSAIGGRVELGSRSSGPCYEIHVSGGASGLSVVGV